MLFALLQLLMEQDELTRSENEGDCLHFTSVPLLMKAVHQGLQPQNNFGPFSVFDFFLFKTVGKC